MASFDGYTDRYAAYCRAHFASSAAEMDERHRRCFPSHRMAGFVAWIGDQWRAWAASAGRPINGSRTAADHVAFDAWLAKRYAHMPIIARIVPPARPSQVS